MVSSVNPIKSVTDEELYHLWSELGYCGSSVAKEIGCTRQRVQQRLRRFGAPSVREMKSQQREELKKIKQYWKEHLLDYNMNKLLDASPLNPDTGCRTPAFGSHISNNQVRVRGNNGKQYDYARIVIERRLGRPLTRREHTHRICNTKGCLTEEHITVSTV